MKSNGSRFVVVLRIMDACMKMNFEWEISSALMLMLAKDTNKEMA